MNWKCEKTKKQNIFSSCVKKKKKSGINLNFFTQKWNK